MDLFCSALFIPLADMKSIETGNVFWRSTGITVNNHVHRHEFVLGMIMQPSIKRLTIWQTTPVKLQSMWPLTGGQFAMGRSPAFGKFFTV
jgi:hypothetical protein